MCFRLRRNVLPKSRTKPIACGEESTAHKTHWAAHKTRCSERKKTRVAASRTASTGCGDKKGLYEKKCASNISLTTQTYYVFYALLDTTSLRTYDF